MKKRMQKKQQKSEKKIIRKKRYIKVHGGTGYYYGPPMIGKEPSIHSYDNRCCDHHTDYTVGGMKKKPIRLNSKSVENRHMKNALKSLYDQMKKLDKVQISAIITLIVVDDHRNRNRDDVDADTNIIMFGGGTQLIGTLLPYAKELLALLAGVWLIKYFTGKGYMKQFGGSCGSAEPSLTEKLMQIIDKGTATKRQTGATHVYIIKETIAPMIGNLAEGGKTTKVGGREALQKGEDILPDLTTFMQDIYAKRITKKNLVGALRKVDENIEDLLTTVGMKGLASKVKNMVKKTVGGAMIEQPRYGCIENSTMFD
jgi:hypothetical protein